MIYLDNSATSIKKPISVAKAMYDSIVSETYGNPSRGSYDASLVALREIYNTRKEIADLFKIDDPLNVVLGENATFLLNLIIRGIFNNKDHIITSVAEHNSVLRPLYQLENEGASLSFLPLKEGGYIDLDELEKLKRENTRGIVITQASNVSGIATDLDKVFDFCLENNLIAIVDGSQGAGNLNFDFKYRTFPNTVYIFTGHKSLHGPQGTGGAVFYGDFDLEPVFSGGSGMNSFSHSQPNILPDIFEPGTHNVTSNIGLKEGIIDIRKIGIKNIERELYEKISYFYKGLKENENIIFYSDLAPRMTPIVAINHKKYSSSELSEILWENYEIATRAGSHCAPKYHESMETIDMGMCRFSLSIYTSYEELDFTIKALKEI